MEYNYKNYKPMNSKEIKEFHNYLKNQYNSSKKLNYLFFKKKDKFYIVSKKFKDLKIERLNLNSLGLYIAKEDLGSIRLTIEGSQLIGPKAKKNVLELNDPTEWMSGNDIITNENYSGFILIKYKKDFLGSGLFNKNKVINFIPKSRRIK